MQLYIRSTILSCRLDKMSITVAYTQKAYVKEPMSLRRSEQTGQSAKSPLGSVDVEWWSGAKRRRLPRHPVTFKDVIRGTEG